MSTGQAAMAVLGR